MLIPSLGDDIIFNHASLSRRVNANSQLQKIALYKRLKLIKKGEC